MTGATIPATMKPWHGGDSAPADWDGGPTLRKHGGAAMLPWRWHHIGAIGDVIAYTPIADQPSPPVVDGGLVERLTHNIETQRVLIDQQPAGSVEREAARLAYAVMRDARTAILAALSSPTSIDRIRAAIQDHRIAINDMARSGDYVEGAQDMLDKVAGLRVTEPADGEQSRTPARKVRSTWPSSFEKEPRDDR